MFESVAGLAAQAEVKAASLRRRERAVEEGGDAALSAEAAIERSQLHFIAQSINELMQKVVELGAVPKGIEPALVDFPSRVDGRDVYLCWKFGEKRVSHYHPFDEGFATRKPLKRGNPGRNAPGAQ
ncbi:MAG: DUF2203 domain-containing protein [Elusimicrobiota bacterium]|nr:MAG: DUF2203 domain-containing protein [Elusimicrobiota bacterium]